MTNEDVPYVLDDQIGYLMRLATQRHTAIFQEAMAEGLTPTQFSVLGIYNPILVVPQQIQVRIA